MNENETKFRAAEAEVEEFGAEEPEAVESGPLFDNNAAELISAIALIGTITLNTEALGPNFEFAAAGFHLIIFLLLKEAWRYHQEGEYTKKDLAKALTRIAAPFLVGGVINNAESIGQTLQQIDQTIGFSQAAADVMPKIVVGLGLAGVSAVGITKVGNALLKAYRSCKVAIGEKANQGLAYVKSFEPQNPVRDLQMPLKKLELQSPVKNAEWQWPIKLSWPWRKRSQDG